MSLHDSMLPVLPDDASVAALAGRVWRPDLAGPAVVAIRDGAAVDISRSFATMRDLCEAADPSAALRAADGPSLGPLAAILANTPPERRDAMRPWLLAPVDLQAIKACGVTFPISMTAQELFDNSDANGNPTPQNAFAALNNLQLALASGDSASISTALGDVQSASTFLNQQLAFYGTAQNRITSALDLAQKFQLQDQTNLSNLQDTNAPAVALQLTQDSTDLSAAMSAQARMPTTSLFDYLPVG